MFFANLVALVGAFFIIRYFIKKAHSAWVDYEFDQWWEDQKDKHIE